MAVYDEDRTRYRSRLRYLCDLTNAEWDLIPPAMRGDKKPTVKLREVVNRLMRVLSAGYQCQAIAKDLPPSSTLHGYLDLWSWDGTLGCKGGEVTGVWDVPFARSADNIISERAQAADDVGIPADATSIFFEASVADKVPAFSIRPCHSRYSFSSASIRLDFDTPTEKKMKKIALSILLFLNSLIIVFAKPVSNFNVVSGSPYARLRTHGSAHWSPKVNQRFSTRSKLKSEDSTQELYPSLLFIGAQPLVPKGADFHHHEMKSNWLEGQIQATESETTLSAVSRAGAPYGLLGGARTSDNPYLAGFSIANQAYCLNDKSVANIACIGFYAEARTFPGSGSGQSAEFDSINLGGSASHLSPYAWINNLPMTANQWLSVGRPDIQMLYFGGKISAGDILNLTVTGLPEGPRSVRYVVKASDTFLQITESIAASINADPTIVGAVPSKLYADAASGNAAKNSNWVLIGNNSPAITWKGSTSKDATETITETRGGQSSAGIGIINNCNSDQTCGSLKSGIFFDRFALVGTDGSDASSTFGEAIGFGRNQALNWYDSSGKVKAEIVGSTTSPGRCRPQIKAGDLGWDFGEIDGKPWGQIGPNGIISNGSIAAKGAFFGVLATPSSSSAACEAGEFMDDSNYHYVCVAPNKWKRVALSPF